MDLISSKDLAQQFTLLLLKDFLSILHVRFQFPKALCSQVFFVDHNICLGSATASERAERCGENSGFRFHLHPHFVAAT